MFSHSVVYLFVILFFLLCVSVFIRINTMCTGFCHFCFCFMCVWHSIEAIISKKNFSYMFPSRSFMVSGVCLSLINFEFIFMFAENKYLILFLSIRFPSLPWFFYWGVCPISTVYSFFIQLNVKLNENSDKTQLSMCVCLCVSMTGYYC